MALSLCLVVFPTFFNLSLNLVIKSSWSEPLSAPSLVFADCIELLHLWLQRTNQFEFTIDYLVISMYRVLSCVFGRGCLLWPVHSLGKTLWAFALFHFVLQGQTCLLLHIFLDFLLLHSNPLWWKGLLLLLLLLLFFFFGVSSRRLIGGKVFYMEWKNKYFVSKCLLGYAETVGLREEYNRFC